MARQFTLGKNERLKSRKQIEQLFSEGKKIAVNPLIVYYLFAPLTINNSPGSENLSAAGLAESGSSANKLFPVRFGTGLSSKIFKRAVDRNRIKRLIKEAYRLQKNELQEKLNEKNLSLNVFFIFTGKELTEYKQIHAAVGVALQKLLNEIGQQPKK